VLHKVVEKADFRFFVCGAYRRVKKLILLR
jgi:hypothetical protein